MIRTARAVRLKLTACAVLVAMGLVAASASQADGPPAAKRTVRLGDNYFLPDQMTVPRDTLVTWRWPREAGDVHDVKLTTRPAGVRRFHSIPAASDYSFKRRLKVPGRYRIVCTLHEEMTMSIRVKRPG